MTQETKPITITGYKGFDKNLQCRGFQYEVGKEYETNETELCKRGFHFCENPHDVFSYYNAGEGNRFAIVEASDVSDEKKEDSKRVSKRIRIKAEISVFEICKIAVSTFFENFGFNKKIESAETNNAGYRGAANAGSCGAANAGDWGAANAGNYGAANAGDWGAANAGDYGAANAGNRGAANAGDWGAANAGYRGAANAGNRGAANAGDWGAANAGNYGAANAGDWGAANAGDYGAANAGDWGAANAGNYGAAIVSNGGKVKGGKGCVLVARNIEWNDDTAQYEVTDWACGIVDGVNIKEDTWYRLENGKLVEADAEENNQ